MTLASAFRNTTPKTEALEASLAASWSSLARREGHMRAVPKSIAIASDNARHGGIASSIKRGQLPRSCNQPLRDLILSALPGTIAQVATALDFTPQHVGSILSDMYDDRLVTIATRGRNRIWEATP